jgi:hypothetical protein
MEAKEATYLGTWLCCKLMYMHGLNTNSECQFIL